MNKSDGAVAEEMVTSCPEKGGEEESEGGVVAEKGRYLSGWPLTIVTISLCLGTFLVALDVNIIGVAVPRISSVFNSLDDVAWYGSAYLLTVTAFQPLLGSIYKFFNVRATYLVVILIFEAGSVICAAAPNSTTFIVGRAIAGLGAAGILQGALAIIGYAVELERRPLFMGIVISVFGVSVCTGPVMGGAFTDSLSWRWCFWINLPIGGPVLVLLLAFLRLKGTDNEDRSLSLKAKAKHMDFLGTTVFLGALCCLILALQWGGQSLPWSSSEVIGLFVGFGLLAIIFGYIQWRLGDKAIIPLRILRQRSMLAGFSFLFFFGMLNYVYSFYLPFYFQAVQGVSATTSGIRIIPLVLSQIVLIILTGAVVTQWGYYVPYMIVGQAICAIGAGLITRLDLGTSTLLWASYLVITGIGMGMSMQLPYTALQVVLGESDAPIGNAISVFSNQLGGVIAIPICQAFLLNTLRSTLPRYTTAVSAEAVIYAGPANLVALASGDPGVLLALRRAYTLSLQRTYVFALAAGCVAAVCTFGMEWKNVKREAERRKVERNGEARKSEYLAEESGEVEQA